MKKSIFFTIAITLLVGTLLLCINKTYRIKDIIMNLDSNSNLVVSIHGKDITKDDLPKEYETLNDNQKRRFLSRYIYLKVALDTLKKEKEKYKQNINEAIKQEKNKLDKIGVTLSSLEELILKQDIEFQTIAFNEVLKYHKDIDKDIEKYYNEHEQKFDYPNRLELSHISIKDKDKAEKILKELLDKNASIKEFSEYARKYSKDYKTAIMGGYVGKIGEDELGKKFFKQIWDSNISNAIYTKLLKGKKNYYHILYILDKNKAHKGTLKEEENNIKQFLLEKEIRVWKAKHFTKSDKNSSVKVYDIKLENRN